MNTRERKRATSALKREIERDDTRAKENNMALKRGRTRWGSKRNETSRAKARKRKIENKKERERRRAVRR